MFPIYSKNLILCENKLFRDNIHENNKMIVRSRTLLKPKLFLSKQFTQKKSIKKYNILETFVSNSFWQKIIHKYWQETLYLSIYDPEAEIYMNKLKTLHLCSYRSIDYKIFLNDFTKALLKNNLMINLKKSIFLKDPIIKDNNMYIKYIWHKQLSLFVNSLNIFDEKNQNLKKNYNNLMAKSIHNTLPVFTIKNVNNKILMGESGCINKNSINAFYHDCKSFIFRTNIAKKQYLALFFIHPDDALEYQSYVYNKHLISTRNNNLYLSVSSLFSYYNVMNSSNKRVEYRLIPDLREMSELVNKYQYYKHVSIDHRQQYGHNYFQGQPIYIIKPIKVRHKRINEKKNITYHYPSNSQKYSKSKTVFLTYDNAILAWKIFKEKYNDYVLPNKPLLHVHNLEEFIKYLDQYNAQSYENEHLEQDKLLVVPPFQSYEYIKNRLIDKSRIKFQEKMRDQLIYCKKIFERTIWSLTSRQPVKL